MKIFPIHRWDNLTIDDARQIQRELAQQTIIEGKPDSVKIIAASDVAFSRADDTAFGAVVVLSFPDFEVLEIHTGAERIRFPYIPGFLSFREAPLLLKLYEKVKLTPDVVMIDGQGIAHPRRLGLAAHIGLFLRVPTIGVAKSHLFGRYDMPGPRKGNCSYLYDGDEIIGVVLRTRDSVKPVFVSPGNLISVDAAAEIALACATKYRIPEPTRLADKIVGEFKKNYIASGGENNMLDL